MTFSFGAKPAAAPTQQANTVPSFSLTNATPGGPPAAPFSFGASTQPAGANPTPSLFGNTAQQQQQPAAGSSLFGGGTFGTNNTQPAAGQSGGTGLFGGSLFGNQNQNQQPQQPGLFGQQSQTQPPNPAPSLFGQQPQQQQPGSSLFGQQPQQAQTQGSSLFGQQQQHPQQPGSSLFGQQQPQQQGSSLFGQSTNQQPSSSLFASTPQPQQQSSLFGQPQNQNQGLGQSQNQQNGGLNKASRLADLPEGLQKGIEQLDDFIKQKKAIGAGVSSDELGRALNQTQLDIQTAKQTYNALNSGLASLITTGTQLQAKLKASEKDVVALRDIGELYRQSGENKQQNTVRTVTPSQREFAPAFFGKQAGEMEGRIKRYKETLGSLNRAISSLASDTERASPQAIAITIQNHQNALLTLAAQLERLNFRLRNVRSVFSEEWKEKNNTYRDPFQKAREGRLVPA